MAEDRVFETHSQGATRFPDGDRTLAASSSTAESGEFESHGVTRALVSSEARPLSGSLSIEAVGGDRQAAGYAQTRAVVVSPPHCVPYRGFEPRTSPGLGRAPLPFGLERHGVTDRIRTGPLTLARSDAYR